MRKSFKWLLLFTGVQLAVTLALSVHRGGKSAAASVVTQSGLFGTGRSLTAAGPSMWSSSSSGQFDRSARKMEATRDAAEIDQRHHPSLTSSAPIPTTGPVIAHKQRPEILLVSSPGVASIATEVSGKHISISRGALSIQESENALAVPLAFISLPADSTLSPSQNSNLSQIAATFVEAVDRPGQSSTDIDYAKRYFDAQRAADEQVWAVSGQDAYTALVNQRSQNAGNVTPTP